MYDWSCNPGLGTVVIVIENEFNVPDRRLQAVAEHMALHLIWTQILLLEVSFPSFDFFHFWTSFYWAHGTQNCRCLHPKTSGHITHKPHSYPIPTVTTPHPPPTQRRRKEEKKVLHEFNPSGTKCLMSMSRRTKVFKYTHYSSRTFVAGLVFAAHTCCVLRLSYRIRVPVLRMCHSISASSS